MSITFGNKKTASLYFGSRKVLNVYFGSKLIWQPSIPPQSFDDNVEIYMDDDALANNIFKWSVRNKNTFEDLGSLIGRSNYWLYDPDGSLIENRGTTAKMRDLNNLPDGTYTINLNCQNSVDLTKVPSSGTVSFKCNKVKVWKHKYMLQFDAIDSPVNTQFVFGGGSMKINGVLISEDQLYQAEMYNPYLNPPSYQNIPDKTFKKWITANEQFSVDYNYFRIYLYSDEDISTFSIDSGTYYDPQAGKTIRVSFYEITNDENTKIGEDEFVSSGASSTRSTYTLRI